MTIGERIKKRRTELKLSQEELAYKLGYTHKSSIHNIESGKQQLTQSKIVATAEALGTTIDWLMGWEEDDSDLDVSPSKKVLIDSFVNKMSLLNEDEIKEVLNYMDYLQHKH